MSRAVSNTPTPETSQEVFSDLDACRKADTREYHYRTTRRKKTDPGDGFKINNDYNSRYARMVMAENADLDGLFETRELKAL